MSAEAEFKNAVTLLNQGRVDESMDALRATLAIDAAHANALQTLIALALERGQPNEARRALAQALEAMPSQSAWAIMLARLLAESGDTSGAIEVLRKHAAAGQAHADFHGLAAALYQKLAQHREAINEYVAATRLAPQVGAYWMGLGISQQAMGATKEASEAFQRAKSSGSLHADLITFVDQRLKQLE